MKKIFSFFTVIVTSAILNTMSIFNIYKKSSVQHSDFSLDLPDGGHGRYYFAHHKMYVSKVYNSLSVTKTRDGIYPIEVFHVFEWETGTYIAELDKRIIVDAEDTLFSQINWNNEVITNSRTLHHLYNDVYLGNVINPGRVDDLGSARYLCQQNLIKKTDLTSGGKLTPESIFDPVPKIDAKLSVGFTWYRNPANGKYYLQFSTYFYGLYTGKFSLSLLIHVGRSFQLV